MTTMTDDAGRPPTHLDAIQEAWHEFKEGVAYNAFCLSDPGEGSRRQLRTAIAWLCAPWRPLAYRFTPDSLERLFRPQKAERRQRLSNLREYVFVCGAEAWTEDRWAEAEALVAEFGGGFPPRDWEPMSVAESVGAIMGYSREEVAEIVAAPSEHQP